MKTHEWLVADGYSIHSRPAVIVAWSSFVIPASASEHACRATELALHTLTSQLQRATNEEIWSHQTATNLEGLLDKDPPAKDYDERPYESLRGYVIQMSATPTP